MTSPIPYDTDPWVVINHAQFDVCMPSSFGGVNTDRKRKNLLLDGIDEERAACSQRRKILWPVEELCG